MLHNSYPTEKLALDLNTSMNFLAAPVTNAISECVNKIYINLPFPYTALHLSKPKEL